MTDKDPTGPPFERHKTAYLIIKIFVLIAGLFLALRLLNVI